MNLINLFFDNLNDFYYYPTVNDIKEVFKIENT